MTELLEVGRITKPHGLAGDVLVKFTTDLVEARTESGTTFTLAGDRQLLLAAASRHNDRWIVHFAGVDTREAAQALHSQTLYAEPLADTGGLFVHEVIGAVLRTTDGTEYGPVTAVVANPASDLMELETGQLVPMTFITDHDARFVTVEVPPGLLSGDPI